MTIVGAHDINQYLQQTAHQNYNADLKLCLEHLEVLVKEDTSAYDDLERQKSNHNLIDYVRACLHQYGFHTIKITLDHKRANLIALSPSLNLPYFKHNNLEDNNLGLLLSGHVDTVPFNAQKWQYDPLNISLNEHKIYGRGCVDMKGYLASMLTLAHKIKHQYQDYNLYPKISFAFTFDEETSMAGAQILGDITTVKLSQLRFKTGFGDILAQAQIEILKNNDSQAINLQDIANKQEQMSIDNLFINKRFNLILIGEATEHKAVIAHKGWLSAQINIKGKAAHASDPNQGINAIEYSLPLLHELKHLKERLKAEFALPQSQNNEPNFKLPYATLNLGTIKGGVAINTVCEEVNLAFEIRLTPNFNTHMAKQELNYIIHKLNTEHNNIFSLTYPFPAIEAFKSKTLNKQEQDYLTLVTNYANQVEYVNYCTEAAFLQKLGPCVVIGPGSINEAHKVDEFISLSELDKSNQFLNFIAQYF